MRPSTGSLLASLENLGTNFVVAKQIKSHSATSDYFLVCGLGRLGQQAVVVLKCFKVTVLAINQQGITRYIAVIIHCTIPILGYLWGDRLNFSDS